MAFVSLKDFFSPAWGLGPPSNSTSGARPGAWRRERFAGIVAGLYLPRTRHGRGTFSSNNSPRLSIGLISIWPSSKFPHGGAQSHFHQSRLPIFRSAHPVWMTARCRSRSAIRSTRRCSTRCGSMRAARCSLRWRPRPEIEKALKKYYGVGAETLDEMDEEEAPMDLELPSGQGNHRERPGSQRHQIRQPGHLGSLQRSRDGHSF